MMMNKRFAFYHDNVALNLKTPILDFEKKLSIGEVLEIMNNLNDENEQLKQFKEQVFKAIEEKILECEKAVEDIRYNGKDSYIVKHDVASKLLKELKKELQE